MILDLRFTQKWNLDDFLSWKSLQKLNRLSQGTVWRSLQQFLIRITRLEERVVSLSVSLGRLSWFGHDDVFERFTVRITNDDYHMTEIWKSCLKERVGSIFFSHIDFQIWSLAPL